MTVNGGTRHVHGYLRDFLFPPERARSPVKALSGGERNRLLLARLFTRPANVLVLDEPTNDLDIETLELLEAQLVEWPGTLLLVSHDRALPRQRRDEHARVRGRRAASQEYVGGYEDWEHHRRAIGAPTSLTPAPARPAPEVPAAAPAPKASTTAKAGAPAASAAPVKVKLSFKEQRELESLPARIEALEAERDALRARTTGPEFYKESADAIRVALARLDAIDGELSRAYDRWNALEARA